MKYSIETLPGFDRQLKKLTKKYKSLNKDFEDFISELRRSPGIGVDLGKGVITLLAIYDKAEQDTISDKEIVLLIQEL